MSDLISRRAAIDALNALEKDGHAYVNGAFFETILRDEANRVLEELPSAQPKFDWEKLNDAHNEGYDVGYWAGRRDHAQKWIPCSERLPEANGRYLVTRGLNACGSLWNRVYITNYSDLMGLKSERIWWHGSVGKSDFERLDDVLAWMPLPEPYEERRTDERLN